ncbi:pirin family protein [Pontibacter harenae]|uniref:pirin family protein n=1 Tax=Pontibacter harenae TaxID=2894083 RepID=UPI001E32610D|nr:pirin family protein [Pontibacter harenae]MCC9166209.1 pirin family protein [Pontibacter harenae]
MSKKVIHKADTRGHANHGWLNSYHSFSFAGYYNPERMSFGLLRVLNDDEVAAGMGFGAHPHDNMEIVSVPLSGALEHQDSTGNRKVIYTNDVQIMSAGTGLTHSEYNHSKEEKVKFLQIWVFPKEREIKPRYEQKTFNPEDRQNKLQTVVSPEKGSDAVWINQDAWFTLGTLKGGFSEDYKLHKNGNGVYAFVLEGEVEIDGEKLGRRDGLGISETDSFNIKASEDAELLLMEVPMK